MVRIWNFSFYKTNLVDNNVEIFRGRTIMRRSLKNAAPETLK
jgi:hypothetical protein